MAVPISFPSTTARYSLPMLFAGQAQKEFAINQSLAVIDAMLATSVTASLSDPQASVSEGECFRIVAPASGDWLGHEDEIAVWVGGAWQFVVPHTGMSVFDQAAAAFLHYNSGWKSANEPSAPTGGTVVDSEARAALSELIQALRNLGVFPDSP